MRKLPKILINKTPTYLKISEGEDFFKLFSKIEAKFENCFILESLGEQGSLSRYSIIGFDPKHIIRAKGNDLFFDEQKFKVKNPYFALREIIPQNVISRNYAGGLIGFISYDATNYFEPNLNIKTHPKFDTFVFGLYLDGVILDKITGEIYYFYYNDNRLSQIKDLAKEKARLGSHQARQVKSVTFKAKFLGNSIDKETHAKIVEKVKQEILAGNTFQCEVGFKSEYKISGNTLGIYQKLRQVNPSPFMYYLKFGETKIVGASPELMFSLRDGQMESQPLAGTIKRGKTQAEDQVLARQLLNDKKEIAEHNMLVDLHRNDLGRVARFGTVKVHNLLDIKKFSHVQHISSDIVGLIRPDEDMFSGLAVNFPMGTVTGAPKVETIKIIDSNESEPRGPYGGAVGHFGFNGDCTFALPLRSLYIFGDYAFTQTCSGIVYDSKPEKEYEEVLRKLAAMKEVLN